MISEVGRREAPGFRFHSDFAVPPGEYLAEVLDVLGIERTGLAEQLHLSPAEMNGLIAGDLSLTAPLAACLEKATGVPANIWVGLEAEYRIALEQTKEMHEECQEKTGGDAGSVPSEARGSYRRNM